MNRTVLWWAADSGSLEVVEYLVKAGADPTIQDFAGNGPLNHAFHWGREYVYLFLLEECVYPYMTWE